jgi:hypothetical protein
MGGNAKNWLGDVNALELGKPNVQQDYVGLQLFCLSDGFDGV